MSEHEDLQADIPALATGRLSADASKILEQHVETCASCAGALALARELAAAGSHPGIAELRRYALGEGAGDAGPLASHLAVCPSCALEAAAWRAPKSRVHGRALAVAAGLAAVLALWVWLGPFAQRGEESAVVVFTSGVRSGDTERTVELTPGQVLRIRAEWEALEPVDEIGPIRLEIAPLTRSSVWSKSFDAVRVAAALRTERGLSAELPAGVLETGEYEFRMLRLASPDEPPLIQERFGVRVGDQRQSPDATKAPQ